MSNPFVHQSQHHVIELYSGCKVTATYARPSCSCGYRPKIRDDELPMTFYYGDLKHHMEGKCDLVGTGIYQTVCDLLEQAIMHLNSLSYCSTDHVTVFPDDWIPKEERNPEQWLPVHVDYMQEVGPMFTIDELADFEYPEMSFIDTSGSNPFEPLAPVPPIPKEADPNPARPQCRSLAKLQSALVDLHERSANKKQHIVVEGHPAFSFTETELSYFLGDGFHTDLPPPPKPPRSTSNEILTFETVIYRQVRLYYHPKFHRFGRLYDEKWYFYKSLLPLTSAEKFRRYLFYERRKVMREQSLVHPYYKYWSIRTV